MNDNFSDKVMFFKLMMEELGFNEVKVEIDQNLYPIPDWAVEQIIRTSGLVENICSHGVGHPDKNWLKLHDPSGSKGYGIHGCDGCCYKR